MLSKSLLFFAAASLLGTTLALTDGHDQVWAGCSTTLPSDATSIGTQSSAAACALACQNQSPAYQYAIAQQPSTSSTTVNCLCSNTGVALGNYITNNEATCLADADYSQYVTSVNGNFLQCNDGGYSTVYTATSFVDCFGKCARNGPVLFHANRAGSQNCYCTFTYSSGSPNTQCTNTGYAYEVTGSSPSGLARRHRYEQLAWQRQALAQLCPFGRSACRTYPNSPSYECLDTTSELESCGGCLYGELVPESREFYTGDADDFVANTTTGVDCSELGRFMTCSSGTCVSI